MSILEGLGATANIHPLFVHFPIALLLVAGALFIAGNFVKKNEMLIVAKWNLILGALFAVVTVVTGFMGEGEIPHNLEIHQAMEVHETIMIAVTIFALGLAGYIYYQKDLLHIKKHKYFLIGLIFMMGLLAIGADYGGKMVFKYGAGTELFLKLNPEASDDHNHDYSNGHEDKRTDDHQNHDNSNKGHSDEHEHKH